MKYANSGNIAAEDHNGLVNGIHSMIRSISIKVNGIQLYENSDANQSC